jgi:hypothetical protein
MGNALTSKEKQAPKTGALKCGDVGTYRDQGKQKTNKQNRDHVPATSSMLAAAKKHPASAGLKGKQLKCFNRFVKMDALTVAIPGGIHRKHSRTYGGKGGADRIKTDVADLEQAAKDDFEAIEKHLSEECQTKYKEAQKEMLAQLPDKHFEACRAKALDPKQCK